MTSLWFDISRCADDEWVRAKDSAAAASAAKAWRRMARRVKERPADIYRSVFTLLDTTQAGVLPLANAVRFLAFVLPFTMPSERLELIKLAMAEHVQQAGASATAGVHSCGTAHVHSYGTAGGSAIVAVGNAHAPAARANSRPMLSRGEFVDLCLRRPGRLTLSDLQTLLRHISTYCTLGPVHYSLVVDAMFLALFVGVCGSAEDRKQIWRCRCRSEAGKIRSRQIKKVREL